jgi:hypothetical protein
LLFVQRTYGSLKKRSFFGAFAFQKPKVFEQACASRHCANLRFIKKLCFLGVQKALQRLSKKNSVFFEELRKAQNSFLNRHTKIFDFCSAFFSLCFAQ